MQNGPFQIVELWSLQVTVQQHENDPLSRALVSDNSQLLQVMMTSLNPTWAGPISNRTADTCEGMWGFSARTTDHI